MTKILSFLLLCLISASAYSEVKPLFYETFNFAENDTLNVRAKPDYKSEKMGELNLDVRLEVSNCINVKKAKWCKVQSLDMNEIEGWVNAKYIISLSYQEGYVTIKNRKSICDYVLKCQEKKNKTQCLVVTRLSNEKNIKLKTEWIDHALLKPATKFTAAADIDLNPEGGFCTRANYVHEYLKDKKIKELSEKFTAPEFATVLTLLKASDEQDEVAINKLIHPKNGMVLSALSYFDDKGSQTFSQKNFVKSYESRIKLNWGETEARGDAVVEDLYAYVETMSADIRHIARVVKLDNFKNFPQKKGQKLKAYEVYWYSDEKLKEYAYTGLVVILESYKGKWYVVGISNDYWTP